MDPSNLPTLIMLLELSHTPPTFQNDLENYLERLISTEFDELDEREQYNYHRLRTIAFQITREQGGINDIIEKKLPIPSTIKPKDAIGTHKRNIMELLWEVEETVSPQPYSINTYLETLVFGGSPGKIFNVWIEQLRKMKEGYEDEFFELMPHEYKENIKLR